MQGLEVSGTLVWTILRKDNGPYLCYQSFGEDLQLMEPANANNQIEAVAVSIVRNSIANLTIHEILKNRRMLKDSMQKEMQQLLNGWGVWLETCEIQDIKISSSTLFQNLQIEFKEKHRMDAEQISAHTQNTIDRENLVRTNEFNRIKTESQTLESIYTSE